MEELSNWGKGSKNVTSFRTDLNNFINGTLPTTSGNWVGDLQSFCPFCISNAQHNVCGGDINLYLSTGFPCMSLVGVNPAY